MLKWLTQSLSTSRVVCMLVAQLCPTLRNPMDCSLPGSAVHGLLQARTLEWVAIPFSRGAVLRLLQLCRVGATLWVWCTGSSLRWLLFWSMCSGACGLQRLWWERLAASWHVWSSWTRDQIPVSCIGRQILHQWTTREAPLFFFEWELGPKMYMERQRNRNNQNKSEKEKNRRTNTSGFQNLLGNYYKPNYVVWRRDRSIDQGNRIDTLEIKS